MKRLRTCLSGLVLTSLCACQQLPTRPSAQAPAAALIEPAPMATAVIEPATESDPAYFWLPPEPRRLDSRQQILEHLRQHLVEPDCRSNPRIQYWQGRYAASPRHFADQITAVLPLMGRVLEELERYQLPAEYALLPIAESWYRPDARGAGDHVGVWQFGRSTAHTLDLPITNRYDARMDPIASTDAALRYLAQLHNQFGDWRLATAAYNAGPYRVKKLIGQTDSDNFSLSRRQPAGLPAITFEHLAKIEALACLLSEPERFGIPLSEHQAVDPLVSIQLKPGQSSLSAIAEHNAISSSLLTQLNPAFRHGFIASDAPRSLLLPASLATNLDDLELPFVPTPKTEPLPAQSSYVIQPGDTLGAIARRHGVALRTLLQLNGLNMRSILRPGQRIRLAP